MDSLHQQQDRSSLEPDTADAPRTLGRRPKGRQTPPRLRIYTPVQVHFLDRLDHLLRLRMAVTPDQAQPWEVEALKRAIYATLRDCIEAGVGEAARAKVHAGSSSVN